MAQICEICKLELTLQIFYCLLYFCATYCGVIFTLPPLLFYSYELICCYVDLSVRGT